MIWPDSYTVRLMDLPLGVKGFVAESPDGHYNVYLNSRYNYETQIHAGKHELDHIANDDLHNDKPIQAVERQQ